LTFGSGVKAAELTACVERMQGVRSIAPVLESSVTVDGLPFVSYDLEGESLLEFVDHSGPLNMVDALYVALSLAHALVDLHARDVIHGHLTPSNVVRTDFGDLSILDVGVAAIAAASTPPLVSLMSERSAVGSPGFMAPELLTFGGAGPEADTYGVGAILYFLLTGHAPFEAVDAIECAKLATTSSPPPIYELVDEPNSDLMELFERLITTDPAKRVPTAEQLVIELEHVCRRSGSRVFSYERRDSGMVVRPLEPTRVTIPRAPRVPTADVGRPASPKSSGPLAKRWAVGRGGGLLLALSVVLVVLAALYLFI
jgi:serine/threonine protein kinase